MARKNRPAAGDLASGETPSSNPSREGWSEDNSLAFLDFGRFFVPDREGQNLGAEPP